MRPKSGESSKRQSPRLNHPKRQVMAQSARLSEGAVRHAASPQGRDHVVGATQIAGAGSGVPYFVLQV